MGWINKALNTGKDLNKVESELAEMGPRDPRRAKLNQQAAKLQRQQTTEVSKALRNGADEKTLRFALGLHGQGPTAPTTEAAPPRRMSCNG
ncbi:hypothetical protein NKG94_52090 [Micromonospora sp. M12]